MRVLSIWVVEVGMKSILVIQFLQECVCVWDRGATNVSSASAVVISKYVISVMYLC